MVSASIDDPIEEVLRTAAGSAYSRIPIYQEDEDHIIGFVHLKDLFLLYRENPGGSVQAVLRPIPYVPESLGVPDLWERLNQEGSYLAVVFDEYGGTAGLVTREDVIEELFGEFQDEFDRERAPIMRIGPASFTVRGDTAILQINDELELDLPQRDTHSIAGFIMEELGRLPVPGDEVTFEGTVLRVQAVRNMTASSVRISFPPDHPLALRKGGR
jgi:CBS domain containing-hemolysin-like protein